MPPPDTHRRGLGPTIPTVPSSPATCGSSPVQAAKIACCQPISTEELRLVDPDPQLSGAADPSAFENARTDTVVAMWSNRSATGEVTLSSPSVLGTGVHLHGGLAHRLIALTGTRIADVLWPPIRRLTRRCGITDTRGNRAGHRGRIHSRCGNERGDPKVDATASIVPTASSRFGAVSVVTAHDPGRVSRTYRAGRHT